MPGCQANIPLDEYYAVALGVITNRDGKTTPSLLRPVIESYLKRRISKDQELADAVDAIIKSRERQRQSKRSRSGKVRSLATPAPIRKGSARKTSSARG